MSKMKKFRRFQNPKAFPCHLAKTELLGHLPLKFVQFGELLARARTKSFKENDLGFACNIIARLASFEGMNTGYFCRFKRSFQMPQSNGNAPTYILTGCTITCQNYDLEEIKSKIENDFFEKYKIRINLELNGHSHKSESFYCMENANVFRLLTSPV